MRYTLEAVLGDAGLDVETADGGAAGIAAFEARGADVVLTDLAMPDFDGMKVLSTMRVQDPTVPVLMLTAHGSERVAVAAMKAGAFDYIPKPFDPDEVILSVGRGIETRKLRLENARLRTEASLGRPIIAESPALRRVLDLVARVAPKDVTVLLTGESGVGKDVLAATLHAHSRRADKPLVRFNAAAIPAELAESELFGHTKGAFTGAHEARKGYFQQADKGTLFIDEIGELPLAMQAKVLRTLQSGEVQPVGGRAEIVDVRLVAATNRDLAAEARAGRFREDLYYRLNVVSISLPPLRDRGEDTVVIARWFLQRHAKEFGSRVRGFTPSALVAMRKYAWPGNVRELENRVKKAVVLADRALVSAEDLDLRPEILEPVLPLAQAKEEFQKRYINDVLERNGGNRTKTAKDLGVDPRTIFRHLEKLEAERRGQTPPPDDEEIEA